MTQHLTSLVERDRHIGILRLWGMPTSVWAANEIESLNSEVMRRKTDCEFLLSVIDNCDEAEAPSDEMEPEDVANIARIRASLQERGG